MPLEFVLLPTAGAVILSLAVWYFVPAWDDVLMTAAGVSSLLLAYFGLDLAWQLALRASDGATVNLKYGLAISAVVPAVVTTMRGILRLFRAAKAG
ncbi:hypothetical protein [Ciceribacter sp. RN22]|uniref:hypothetical protein n=1 Tax=Ciceribacter sp. RN22 TaxID=2954932 RepID=UPI002093CC72|nr:hypothetical protein [Ciceribacter sp. RN22]MCO6178235.1 hypothetical protein [Ciceribacter sp. RN22]